MEDITVEARTNSKVTFFYEPIHMNVQVLTDQQEFIYIGTQDVVWKGSLEQWMIGRDG